jgi:hypothetical protein
MSENEDYDKLMKRYCKMFELARDHMNSCDSFRNKVLKDFENE